MPNVDASTRAAFPGGAHVAITPGAGRPLFVEPYVDGVYKKFNSNHGTVGRSLGLDPLVDQVPQAFSHWTLDRSDGSQLVCDIQGVYDERTRTFTLVDPVIHSVSGAGASRKGTHGRTDHGVRGIESFLQSHCCNDLCRQLHLPHNHKYTGGPQGGGGSSLTSKPTEEYTVIKIKHLKQRQNQRDIDTLLLQQARKHGDKVAAGDGKVMHKLGNLRYVTDKSERKGVTAYQDDGR